MPVEEARARGNPGKRRLGKVPPFRALRPDLPDYLDHRANTFLERLIPELERVGILRVNDGMALGMMADRVSEVLSWRALVKEVGRPLATKRGYVREMRRAEAMLWKWSTEFGMTAVSRTRLAIRDGDMPPAGNGGAGPDDPEDDLD